MLSSLAYLTFLILYAVPIIQIFLKLNFPGPLWRAANQALTFPKSVYLQLAHFPYCVCVLRSLELGCWRKAVKCTPMALQLQTKAQCPEKCAPLAAPSFQCLLPGLPPSPILTTQGRGHALWLEAWPVAEFPCPALSCSERLAFRNVVSTHCAHNSVQYISAYNHRKYCHYNVQAHAFVPHKPHVADTHDQ